MNYLLESGLRDVLESLASALIVLDAARSPIFVNSAAQLMLGWARSDQTPMRLAIERNRWLARMVESCSEQGHSIEGAGELLTIDGRQLPAQAEVTPLIDRAGARQGVVVVLRELAHHEKLPAINGEDESVAGLSATGLAHEVRNPLAGIKGAAELLAGMFPSEQRVKLYCGVIADGTAKIAALVERVLALGQRRSRPAAAVNVHRVLDDAVRIAGLGPQMRDDIRLERRFDPSLPPVLGDADELLQAFLNIIRNSIEALDTAGNAAPASKVIRVRTHMESVIRRAANEQRRNFMRVEVTDNGRGVSNEEFRQLFTAFFTTKASGTGLGLLLSRRVIGRHGGRLWAERRGLGDEKSREAAEAPHQRSGLTICVVLPIAPAAGGDEAIQ